MEPACGGYSLGMSKGPVARDPLELAALALEKRASLLARSDLDAVRVLHGPADGIPGLVIERLGPALIVQCHEERLRLREAGVQGVARFFHERLGTRGVYRKVFVRDRARVPDELNAEHHSATPWYGEPVDADFPIHEQGLRFLVRAYDGFSTGLFLEQRDNRQRVRQLSAGRVVLNTFAYTCGFSVAAAVGGAAHVDSVDVSAAYLEWGRANFAANGVDLGPHRFFCSDVIDFYKRAARQGRRYDLIVLDPPTFARLRRPKRNFVLEDELEPLCGGAMDLLNPGGHLLLSTNHRELDRDRLNDAIHATAGRRLAGIQDCPLPADFAGDPRFARAVLARLKETPAPCR